MSMKAVQFSGGNVDECVEFLGDKAGECDELEIRFEGPLGSLVARPSDWIIMGHSGGFIPMNDAAFNVIYEKA